MLLTDEKNFGFSFQRSFYLVYFSALLGDWLQGPYVYKLYAYYGFKESQIAVLYVAGFASSVLFGNHLFQIALSEIYKTQHEN